MPHCAQSNQSDVILIERGVDSSRCDNDAYLQFLAAGDGPEAAEAERRAAGLAQHSDKSTLLSFAAWKDPGESQAKPSPSAIGFFAGRPDHFHV